MDINRRSAAFRRLPIEDQRRLLGKERLERERRERQRMTALSKRPADLRPRLRKLHADIV